MKAVITKKEFLKEYEKEWGKNYLFRIEYNGKTGRYFSKNSNCPEFNEGQEAEFIETEKIYNGDVYYDIKLIPKSKQANYGKALKKEQSRYSGFAVSYVKDLIIAGKVDIKDWERASKKIFNFMVDLDKSLEQ